MARGRACPLRASPKRRESRTNSSGGSASGNTQPREQDDDLTREEIGDLEHSLVVGRASFDGDDPERYNYEGALSLIHI